MALRRIECADRPEWLRVRRALGVGASEAAAVLGLSRFASPAEVYFSKRQTVQDSDADKPAYLWWGLRLETAIAERYALDTGRTVEDPGDYTIFYDDEKPWRFATLDRWVVDLPGPMELKNVRGTMRRYWHDGVPLEVQIQAQQQMAVMGSERASVAVLFEGADFEFHDIERHPAFIELLDERTRAFWEDMKRGIVPIDGDRRTRDIINEQYESRADSMIKLGPIFEEWDRRRMQAMDAIKAAEAVKNEAEAQIILAMETAERAVIADSGVVYKRTKVDRAAFSVAASTQMRLTRSAPKAKR